MITCVGIIGLRADEIMRYIVGEQVGAATMPSKYLGAREGVKSSRDGKLSFSKRPHNHLWLVGVQRLGLSQ